jgi:hypothetical protein
LKGDVGESVPEYLVALAQSPVSSFNILILIIFLIVDVGSKNQRALAIDLIQLFLG